MTVYDIAAKLGCASDGSGPLEILLDDIVDWYVTFAEDDYEIEINPLVVEHVLAHRPLTDALCRL
ncbi:MAG TPA: hypothetical protein VFX61_15095 [Micromonosporaceae bacterium]|nr:hypothetical protein [Micromonosporaceae bacterium]